MNDFIQKQLVFVFFFAVIFFLKLIFDQCDVKKRKNINWIFLFLIGSTILAIVIFLYLNNIVLLKKGLVFLAVAFLIGLAYPVGSLLFMMMKVCFLETKLFLRRLFNK